MLDIVFLKDLIEMRKILLEGRTIRSAQDAVKLLDSGKLAGRLGGKKFVPSWLTDQPNMFENLVDLTLDNIDDDPSVAGDEVIQFMILASSTGPELWQNVVVEVPDVLNELSKAFATQWFTKSAKWQERLQELRNSETFNLEVWHDLEKDIQEEFTKRRAKKHKTVSNVNLLYDTLYEDPEWKLCVPKSFEGSIELASHMKPFESGKKTYTKTRWCTAANKGYYDRYTHDGQNKLYIIQRWVNGEYVDAWQMAFEADSILCMNKHDKANYIAVKKNAPTELLERIVVDHGQNRFFGWNIKELWDLAPDPEDLVSVYQLSTKTLIEIKPELYQHRGIFWTTNEGKTLAALDPVEDLEEVHIPEGVVYLSLSVRRALCNVHTIHIPQSLCNSSGSAFVRSYAGETASVQKLIFEEGIQEIPTDFAVGFKELTEAVLPSTLTSIADRAFNRCWELKHINFPTGLRRIGATAFSYSSLESIELPDSIEYVGTEAFSNCRDLVQVDLPNHKIETGSHVFEACSKLQKVTNMQYLADVAEVFTGCTALDTDKLLSCSTRIPEQFYQDCKNLNDFVVKDNIEEIGKRAFSRSTLKTIVIGKNVKRICEEAFAYCRHLEVVDFSKATSLKEIEKDAFYYCTSLKEIILPESLELLGSGAFDSCKALKKVTMQGSALRELTKEVFRNCISLEHITIPESVRKIGKECFAHCTSLQQIDLPSELKQLGIDVFSECSALKSVTLPKGVKSIPGQCFYHCTSLETIKVPTKLSRVGPLAFCSCKNLIDVIPYGNLNDFDLYRDVSFHKDSFYKSPFEEVLKAADVF